MSWKKREDYKLHKDTIDEDGRMVFIDISTSFNSNNKKF